MTFIEFITLLFFNMLSMVVFSYLKEKGKNLATKEDIGIITKEVELVKKDIQISILESKEKFSKLHELRVANLSEFYKKLFDFRDDLRIKLYELQNETPKNTSYQVVLKLITDFHNDFRKVEVLYRDKFSNLVNNMIDKYFTVAIDIKTSSEKQTIYFKDLETYRNIGSTFSNITPEEVEASFHKINKAWDIFEKDILALQQEIKKEIREIFGVLK